jgi:hypothetical protein
MSEITEVNGTPARSGKRARIMVSCVVTEVSAVVDPVRFYETDTVYLIHYVREKNNPSQSIYQEFYDEVVRRIGEVRPTAEIIEVSEPVYYYHDMLRAVLGIYDREKVATGGNMDMYVNLTTGRAEYAAAAMMASMLHNDIIAFTVRADERMLTSEQYRQVFYDGDRPVGQYRTVKDPARVQTFDPSILDGDYLDYLVAIDEVNTRIKKPLIRDYIQKLEEEGLWDYVPDQKKNKTPDEQKKRMQFNRNVTGPLIEKGFLDPTKGARGRFELTEAGLAALRVLKKQRNGFPLPERRGNGPPPRGRGLFSVDGTVDDEPLFVVGEDVQLVPVLVLREVVDEVLELLPVLEPGLLGELRVHDVLVEDHLDQVQRAVAHLAGLPEVVHLVRAGDGVLPCGQGRAEGPVVDHSGVLVVDEVDAAV